MSVRLLLVLACRINTRFDRCYVTYHPSATFRSKEYKNLMFDDIADFARIVKSSYSIAP
jgi:hypothetical protein